MLKNLVFMLQTRKTSKERVNLFYYFRWNESENFTASLIL